VRGAGAGCSIGWQEIRADVNLYISVDGHPCQICSRSVESCLTRSIYKQVFVDELSCIGCRNCTNVCPKTFQMEEDFGRARVFQQKVDGDELLQEAIDTW
jgi:ferredoxin